MVRPKEQLQKKNSGTGVKNMESNRYATIHLRSSPRSLTAQLRYPDPRKAQKLRELAASLQSQIDKKLDPAISHQRPTRRRAGTSPRCERTENNYNGFSLGCGSWPTKQKQERCPTFPTDNDENPVRSPVFFLLSPLAR